MTIDPTVWRRIVAVEFKRQHYGKWDVLLHTSNDFTSDKPGPVGIGIRAFSGLSPSDLSQIRETLSSSERCYVNVGGEISTDALDVEDLSSVYPNTTGKIHT